jgi:hypothetical protein
MMSVLMMVERIEKKEERRKEERLGRKGRGGIGKVWGMGMMSVLVMAWGGKIEDREKGWDGKAEKV